MNVLIVVLSLHVTATVEQLQTYDEAYNKAMKNGSPLLVIVGAKWCPACRQLKAEALDEVGKEDGLRGIEVAFVDIDSDAIAGKLRVGRRIPQVVRFERTPNGNWETQRLHGRRDRLSLLSFARGNDRDSKQPAPSPQAN